MSGKRELVLKVLQGEATERVPVGFWYHFTQENEWLKGFGNQEIIQKNLQGHQKFLKDVEPDFIKLMSDGYFAYPHEQLQGLTSIKDLADLEPLGAEHPWIEEQLDLVRKIKASFTEDIFAFYNVFAPATYFKWLLVGVGQGDKELTDLLEEDAEAVQKVLATIAQDLASLSQRLIEEVGLDGIYLSVQTIQDERLTKELYQTFIAPSELAVLAAANQAQGLNILHICGYEGAKNNLSLFQAYPAQVFNWAVGAEGVSLAQGRKLFQGKTVLGGFANAKSGLLYGGSQTEVEQETRRLIAEAGQTGLILGADCTLPSDIDPKRIDWVRQAARI
ncbi:uroporphyrinogen decarboxylase family protein [Streptococcus oricebi]|uniref:Uroporphyrinogen decarboxylase n=1 Tax=Streptococcus oricebi TaxID=1547447 RepID=A0ABS5B4G6_9STRE|nr:uroporphyrinogen decarboxylase family protein [Streptococcus oricebi]MBP2623700.1 uroporphyrinogen decarboxylase [Streptococcus oricebi]